MARYVSTTGDVHGSIAGFTSQRARGSMIIRSKPSKCKSSPSRNRLSSSAFQFALLTWRNTTPQIREAYNLVTPNPFNTGLQLWTHCCITPRYYQLLTNAPFGPIEPTINPRLQPIEWTLLYISYSAPLDRIRFRFRNDDDSRIFLFVTPTYGLPPSKTFVGRRFWNSKRTRYSHADPGVQKNIDLFGFKSGLLYHFRLTPCFRTSPPAMPSHDFRSKLIP